MNIKEILKDHLTSNALDNYINQINFDNLNSLMEDLVSKLILKFGFEKVKNEIMYDYASEVTNLLTHFIEVGSLQVMANNSMYSNDNQKIRNTVTIIVISLNISLAKNLVKAGVRLKNQNHYFNTDPLEVILSRTLQALEIYRMNENLMDFNTFSKEIMKMNIYNKL